MDVCTFQQTTFMAGGGSVACLVLVLFPVKLCPLVQQKKRSARHSTPAAMPSVTSTAVRRNRISSSYSSSPLARDLNLVLQGCSRLHSRCSTLPNTCPGHWPHSQHQWINRSRLHKAHKGWAFNPLPPHIRAYLPSLPSLPPPRAPVAPRRDTSPVPCTGSAPQMVGRSRAGSHGSATVEPHTLYLSPVYYSMQRGVNTCDKTATMPRNSEHVEAMIPALRGCGESWKTS